MASRRPTLNFVTSPSGLLVPAVTDDPGNDRVDISYDIVPATADGWVLTTEGGMVGWAPPGTGFGVDSIAKAGDTELTGDVTFSEGANVTLTQAGNDIQIAAASGAAGALTQLFDTTLGSAAATIDFSSIPSTYNHLLLVGYLRSTTTATDDGVRFRFNNDSGSNYDYQRVTASSTSIATAGSVGNAQAYAGSCPANSATANIFGLTRLVVPNYANASNNKVAEVYTGEKISAATNAMQTDSVTAFWRSNSAINRITFLLTGAGNYAIGSRITVYGMS